MSEYSNNEVQVPIEESQNQDYIDYVVEEEVQPPKSYPALKIVALVLGILSGLMLLYYAIDITLANMAQIDQYSEMGMEIPFASLLVVFLSLALLYLGAASSFVGALLPNKYAKASILLLALPASWGIINGVPQLIMSIISKVSFQELAQPLFVGLAGLFTLAAAIFSIFASKEKEVPVLFFEEEEEVLADFEEMPRVIAEEEPIAEEVAPVEEPSALEEADSEEAPGEPVEEEKTEE